MHEYVRAYLPLLLSSRKRFGSLRFGTVIKRNFSVKKINNLYNPLSLIMRARVSSRMKLKEKKRSEAKESAESRLCN